MDGIFLRLAGLLLGISLAEARASNSGNPCQPSENPVNPSSFTWINPVQSIQLLSCKAKLPSDPSIAQHMVHAHYPGTCVVSVCRQHVTVHAMSVSACLKRVCFGILS